MKKTILLTGATDGIGLETAKRLVAAGHTVLLHGRSREKLDRTQAALVDAEGADSVASYCADLAKLADVDSLAADVSKDHTAVDVIINNAGVFKTDHTVTENGFDVRFIVNTVAPYLLTQHLLPLLPANGRVINLSSAAQAPVDLAALAGAVRLNDNQAYAQSKLAITMWSLHLAAHLAHKQQIVVAVNPGSLLASKMVKEAYGIEGSDLGKGADILVRAALSDEFDEANGKYFDNDSGRFALPHADALDANKNNQLVSSIEKVIAAIRK